MKKCAFPPKLIVNIFKQKKVKCSYIFLKSIFALSSKSNTDIISVLTRRENNNILNGDFTYNSIVLNQD